MIYMVVGVREEFSDVDGLVDLKAYLDIAKWTREFHGVHECLGLGSVVH